MKNIPYFRATSTKAHNDEICNIVSNDNKENPYLIVLGSGLDDGGFLHHRSWRYQDFQLGITTQANGISKGEALEQVTSYEKEN